MHFIDILPSQLQTISKAALSSRNYNVELRADLLPIASTIHELFLSLKSLAHPLLHDGPLNVKLVLLTILLPFLFYASYTIVTAPPETLPTRRPPGSALKSLSKVVLPTCSVWPSYYLDLARTADENYNCFPNTSSACINMPINILLRDIRQGRIELRYPSKYLYLLIQRQLNIDGWRIHPTITSRERLRAVGWYMLSELATSAGHVRRNVSFPLPHPVLMSNGFSTTMRL